MGRYRTQAAWGEGPDCECVYCGDGGRRHGERVECGGVSGGEGEEGDGVWGVGVLGVGVNGVVVSLKVLGLWGKWLELLWLGVAIHEDGSANPRGGYIQQLCVCYFEYNR